MDPDATNTFAGVTSETARDSAGYNAFIYWGMRVPFEDEANHGGADNRAAASIRAQGPDLEGRGAAAREVFRHEFLCALEPLRENAFPQPIPVEFPPPPRRISPNRVNVDN